MIWHSECHIVELMLSARSTTMKTNSSQAFLSFNLLCIRFYFENDFTLQCSYISKRLSCLTIFENQFLKIFENIHNYFQLLTRPRTLKSYFKIRWSLSHRWCRLQLLDHCRCLVPSTVTVPVLSILRQWRSQMLNRPIRRLRRFHFRQQPCLPFRCHQQHRPYQLFLKLSSNNKEWRYHRLQTRVYYNQNPAMLTACQVNDLKIKQKVIFNLLFRDIQFVDACHILLAVLHAKGVSENAIICQRLRVFSKSTPI